MEIEIAMKANEERKNLKKKNGKKSALEGESHI